jgi:hypothetical protein
VTGINVGECLDRWAAQLLGYPFALGHSGLDRFDAAIALARIVVTRIDDDHVVRRIGKQSGQKGLGYSSQGW